jgi:hypothetical protein
LLVLATARDVLGSLDRVKRVIKVAGFVNAPEGFAQTLSAGTGFQSHD